MAHSVDSPDFGHAAPVQRRSSSRAWYLLPVFLSIIGGLVSFAVLRKRDPPRARNTLLLGIILFGLLAAMAAVGYIAPDAGTPDPASDSRLSVEQIKGNARAAPYDLLLSRDSIYAGDVIHYAGHVHEVVESKDGKSYGLMIEIHDEDDLMTPYDRVIWSNYAPETDEERELIEMLGNPPVISFASSNQAVSVWATLSGLRTFDAITGPHGDALPYITYDLSELDTLGVITGSYDAPETDILMLEVLATGRALGGRAAPADTLHSISYDKIPDYVDKGVVQDALRQALDAWAAANPTVEFRIVDSSEESDVNIEWAEQLPGNILGSYSSRDIPMLIYTAKVHRIVIELGSDGCGPDYMQYSKGRLTYVIAHELGHYLGLGHIDLSNHLMFSKDLFVSDDIFAFNPHGYVVPTLDRSKYDPVAMENLVASVHAIDKELDALVQMRAELRSQGDAAGLDYVRERFDTLTEQRADLYRQGDCLLLGGSG